MKVRLDSVPPSNPAKALSDLPSDLNIPLGEKIARVTTGFVEIKVTSIALSFNTSVLSRLGEWAQDEIIATPLPMAVNLEELKLEIIDDAQPLQSCPTQPPLDVVIPNLTIERDKTGVFSISSNTEGYQGNSSVKEEKQPNTTELELKNQLDLALAEVRILRAKLGEGNTKLQEEEMKHNTLANKFELIQKQMDSLVEEKKSLLDTLKYLQEELLKSGKK